jgi:hypothetical protein
MAEAVEIAAYYIASEALANTMKHALASHIAMSLATRNGSLLLSVRDDKMGGADPSRGSGLAGLADRVEALGGSIHVHSAAGAGTHITVDLPGEHEPTQDARLRNYQPRPGSPCKGSAFCRSHTSGASYSPDGPTVRPRSLAQPGYRSTQDGSDAGR